MSIRLNRLYKLLIVFLIGTAGVTLWQCSEIDCPLDNVVAMQYGLYDAEGKSLTMQDSLTVTAVGTDSILLNRAQNIASFLLPVRYAADTDSIILRFSDTEGDEMRDTICVHHTNEAHFESMDCPLSYFHTITDISYTSHAIERVELVSDQVNYDTQENVRLYLRSFID